MRHLALTSPEMRGEDIRGLQKVLNERLAHYRSRQRLKQDGVYGRETAHAVADIAYIEGLPHGDGSPGVIRLIEHPHLRSPGDVVEGHRREKARSEHHGVPGNGIERIPGIAEQYVGVHESPDNSNWGFPHPAEWEQAFGFHSGVSWCGCFSGSMVILAGGHVDSRVAFCPNIEADARSRTNGFDLWVANHDQGVGTGWLALFNWNGGSEPEHVEIVKEVHSDHLVCVGGNTGGHGGEVAVEPRVYSLVVGYARPRI